MFTGIIEEVGSVISLSSRSLAVKAAKVVKGMEPGCSVAVNGVCLTVTSFDDHSFKVDIMQETLDRSNLGKLLSGDRVNLENALTLQKSLGGHLVQGHVDDTGKVTSCQPESGATRIRISAPPDVMRFVVEKGFIAVDGISLTVVERDEAGFSVSIVGFTLEHTTLGKLESGYEVNLEVDIIAKYVEQLMHRSGQTISLDFLKAHGF
jgi:riboflavin synthase